jgi:hypothetical protein
MLKEAVVVNLRSCPGSVQSQEMSEYPLMFITNSALGDSFFCGEHVRRIRVILARNNPTFAVLVHYQIRLSIISELSPFFKATHLLSMEYPRLF